MAFKFNWDPLIASTSSPGFYVHAKEVLTSALNKSAKPSAVVNSVITVEGLDLGQSAPELEVLEIGDLAEDRFRGVFRMTYEGNAFLTLKTKVQINPLNTCLTTSVGYTSPDTVAAATPLTIPVQLTLSDFKLSGFVILVFSTVKGVTLVFRNDPLESVKVQSTFDSIPFIKEYLQQEIERQVRELFQEELPLAVYRLSLGLLEGETGPPKERRDEDNPPNGTEIDEESFADPLFISLENTEIPSFPEANMLRLRALMNSQRTLSLFTPAIHGAIYRAMPPSTLIAGLDLASLVNMPPTPTNRASGDIKPAIPLYSNGGSHAHLKRRKRKRRIVNLRKDADSAAPSEASSDYSDSVTTASAPECGHRGVGLPSPEARPISVAGDRERSHLRRQLTPPQTGPVLLHRGQRPPLEPIVTDIPRVSTYASPVLIAERPQMGMGGKYTGGIVEKAFMMRFMTEMQRQAVEQQRRGSGGLEGLPNHRTQ